MQLGSFLMTIEMLQQRREQLVRDMEQAKANLHALQGAIQDCDYWIDQLKKSGDSIYEVQ